MALLNTPPNTNRSNISNLTIQPSIPAKNTPKTAYPSISRSNISETVFTNLTGSSRINHSSLKHARVTLSPTDLPSGNEAGKAEASCGTEGKATRLNHSDLSSTCLTNVDYINHVKASDSVLTNLPSISRATVKNSSISGDGTGCGESIYRAKIKNSVLTGTEVQRSELDSVRMVGSKVRRAELRDCDVQNCVIIRTDFKGMKLRNEIWKKGRFLGTLAGKEAGAVPLTANPPASPASPPARRCVPLAPKTKEEEEAAQNAFWQENRSESESESHSETGHDMPPPYVP